MKKKIVALAAAVAVAFFAWYFQPAPQQGGVLTLHVIDVGQGDCMLLESDGKFGLVDSGNRSNGDEIVKYLRGAGVKELDFAAATHPHSDHIGAMPQVLKEFGAKLFVMSDAQNPTQSFENMLDAAGEYCADTRLLYKGDTLTLGSARIDILSPNRDYVDENINNYSLVMQIEAGGRRMLLTGDSEADVEKLYAEQVLNADLLKVGHHGSSTSTSGQLLTAARPKIAVISCGRDNNYGHPHSAVLDKLEDCQVYRTDYNGNMTFSVKDGEIHVSTQK